MSDSGMKVVWVGDCEEVSLVAASEEAQASAPVMAATASVASATVPVASVDQEPAAETTEEEKEGFMIVKAMLRQKIKPERIVARKEPSCLAVQLDGDERKPVCRLYLGGPKRYIGVIGEGQEEIKIEIGSVDDLFEYGELLLKTVNWYKEENVDATVELPEIPYFETNCKPENMALDLLNVVDVIEVMENYVASIRPPEHIREQLDISYKIDNQSIILYEVRPVFNSPGEKIERSYAKATYVKSTGKWKVYWMRASGNWNIYDPMPEVASLKDFVSLVEEDARHCFKG
jgi:hypothetical protein